MTSIKLQQNGDLVMTNTYGPGDSFNEGRRLLEQAKHEEALGHNDDARNSYNSAIRIFNMCKDQDDHKPELAKLLAEADQALQALGSASN
jgi:hypothetical protein